MRTELTVRAAKAFVLPAVSFRLAAGCTYLPPMAVRQQPHQGRHRGLIRYTAWAPTVGPTSRGNMLVIDVPVL